MTDGLQQASKRLWLAVLIDGTTLAYQQAPDAIQRRHNQEAADFREWRSGHEEIAKGGQASIPDLLQ
jgi:hypothetical protein